MKIFSSSVVATLGMTSLFFVGSSAFAPPLAARTVITPTTVPRHSVVSVSPLYVKGKVEEDKESSEASPSKKQADQPANDSASSIFLETDAAPKILGQPIPYSELTIGVLKETFDGERRVSQTPDSVRNLIKAGFTVLVQSGGERGCYLCFVSFENRSFESMLISQSIYFICV